MLFPRLARALACSALFASACLFAQTPRTSEFAIPPLDSASNAFESLELLATLRTEDAQDIAAWAPRVGFIAGEAYADPEALAERLGDDVELRLTLGFGLAAADEFFIELDDDQAALSSLGDVDAFGLLARLGASVSIRARVFDGLQVGVDAWHVEMRSGYVLAGAADIDSSQLGVERTGLQVAARLELGEGISTEVFAGVTRARTPTGRGAEVGDLDALNGDVEIEDLIEHRLYWSTRIRVEVEALTISFGMREFFDGASLLELERAHSFDFELGLALSENSSLVFAITNLTDSATTTEDLPILSPLDPAPSRSLAGISGALDVDEVEGRRFMVAIEARF